MGSIRNTVFVNSEAERESETKGKNGEESE